MASFKDELGTLISEDEDLRRLSVPQPKRCTATAKHKSKDGKRVRCGNPPMPGQRVCRQHGGKAPNSIETANQRAQLQSAVAMLQKLGEKVEPWERIDPREALLDVVQQAYTLKSALEFLIKDLSESDIKGVGATMTIDTEDGQIVVPHSGGAKSVVRMKLYNEALDRCAKVSKMALDVGIEERLVRLAEKQSEVIAMVIRKAVIGLPEPIALQVIKAAADELRFRSATPALPGPNLVEVGVSSNGAS